ncbi:low-density lipoprotein receptor domain containing lost and found [Haematobia irritans]|uniref:low-density lipoprotein receptor domain containing lost and found n=1 Tax=Haematobia irritans TaxID=7368 RepID=UPI003F4F4DA5
MLQPTSCGPGPPDKIVQVNAKELHDNVNDMMAILALANGNSLDSKESQEKDAHETGVLSIECSNDNFEILAKNEKFHSTMIHVTTKPPKSHKNNNNNNANNNNNNNCHLKTQNLYSNKTRAVANCLSKNLTSIPQKSAMAKQVSMDMFSSSSSSSWSSQRSTAFVTMMNRAWSSIGITLHSLYSSKWILLYLMVVAIVTQGPHNVAAEKSKHYYMQSLCKNHFLQQLYRKIDGAVLWSQNERNLDCIITFQTHSILQRFMLRFDMLQLDCNDHLYVYDGAHAVATPKIDISCRQTKQTVSSILTRTNFVTLKYVTDNWGTDANGFKLVITSVKDPKHTCKDFTCGSNGFCIHPDLLCDGINHCSDNSDESVHNLCQNETTSTVFGMDMTWFVMIVVSILLILSAAIVGITICVCRRQEDTNNQHNTAMQLHHTAETNGSSKHLHYTHGGTLSREHTQLPPTSGNWHHPAGPYGYLRTQLNYLKMATKVRPIWCLANFVN